MSISLTNSGLITAASRASDPYRRQRVGGVLSGHAGFVLFFCSAEYPLAALAQALSSAFGALPISGCTTAGELTADGYDRGSVVAICFDRRFFAIETALIDDLEYFDLPTAQPLVDKLLERCRRQAVDQRAQLTLTLLDGLSSREEQVLATLDAALGRIPSFGVPQGTITTNPYPCIRQRALSYPCGGGGHDEYSATV